MVEHVDDGGVIAVVCTVRGNVYQNLENQLHVEQSWRGSPSQKFPAICGTKRLISVLILFIFLALKILFI